MDKSKDRKIIQKQKHPLYLDVLIYFYLFTIGFNYDLIDLVERVLSWLELSFLPMVFIIKNLIPVLRMVCFS